MEDISRHNDDDDRRCSRCHIRIPYGVEYVVREDKDICLHCVRTHRPRPEQDSRQDAGFESSSRRDDDDDHNSGSMFDTGSPFGGLGDSGIDIGGGFDGGGFGGGGGGGDC